MAKPLYPPIEPYDHGRLDLSSPPRTTWELANAWPDAELAIVGKSGHTAGAATGARVAAALDAFARRR